MGVYGNSASRHAQEMRAAARKGVWRRLTAAAGLNRAAKRADAAAGAWVQGGLGEAATMGLLAPLAAAGWHVRHDVRPPWGRGNYDHVLIPPCGTGVVVLDSKKWRRTWTTALVRGRVHCGPEDRHGQVEKAARHAGQVQQLLALPGVVVLPLLVVHGSPVAGRHLAASVPGWSTPVFVLEPGWLVPTLTSRPGVPDAVRAGRVAARVDEVLSPYR